MTYTTLNSDSGRLGPVAADNLLVGAACSFGDASVGAYFGKVPSANGCEEFEVLDGATAYGLTGQYDRQGLTPSRIRARPARPGQPGDRRLRNQITF